MANVNKLVLKNTASNGDAFDRLRVSQPMTLFSSHSVFDKEANLYGEVISGGGTSVHNANSYIAMNVSTNGDGVVRQSYEYIPYQPGKSKLMMFTGVINTAAVANVTSRIGCFDSSVQKTVVSRGGNGVFFEMSGTTMSVGLRTADDSGSPGDNDTKVTQASWNLDAFDGTGPSGLTLTTSDWETTQLYVIDVQWLGVGRIRYGIYYQGIIRYCHEFLNTGKTVPFMKLAKLPVRYEIFSTGVGAAGEMRMICASVMNEDGGQKLLGNTWSYVSPSTSTDNQVFAMRLKTASNRKSVRVTNVIFTPQSSNSYVAWELIRIPSTDYTPNGAWVDSGSPSVEYNVDGSVVTTNQVKIWGEVSLGRSTSSSSIADLFTSFPLTSEIDGTSFVYIVHAIQTTSTNVGLSVNWNELR
ncbi:MAG: hypothetical protein ACYTFG_22090 [Planctomycetota bacterium]|jgi:hypothetical protein